MSRFRSGSKKTPKPGQPLRGGLEALPAIDPADPVGAIDADLSRRTERYLVNRPTTIDRVRERMGVKETESRRQIAEATLSAAIQHSKTPDDGSRLYGRAFQSLPEATKAQLLDALDTDAERQFVRTTFGDYVESSSEAAPETPKTNSREEKIREVARQALKDAGLVPSVDLDETSPTYGRERMVPAARRPAQANPAVPIERLTASSFEQLSPQARRAATQGSEIFQAIEEMKRINPDFEDTADYARLQSKISELSQAHPEAVEFMRNESLEARPMPLDVAAPPSGRQALPPEMRLGYVIGEGMPAETRGDRRAGDARVPADAPNRMGWLQVLNAEQQGRMVGLPLSDEVRNKDPNRANLKYDPKRGQARLDVDPQSLDMADDSPIEASEAELAAALDETEFGSRFNDDPNAEPVEDATRGLDWREAVAMGLPDAPQGEVLSRGTAQGSPTQVKADRDYALREGKSFAEKWREKLFRVAMEMQDAGFVDAGAVREPSGMFDTAEGVRDTFINELTVSDPAPRRRTPGSAPREIKGKPLPLDGIIPAWRAKMHFWDGGDEIVVRRPNAREVAGFLLDRFDIGDPSMAAQLEPAVQRAMDALEGTPPKANSKAARLSGAVLQPGDRYRKVLEKQAMGMRQPGDTRPLINEAAQAEMAQAPGTFTPVQELPQAESQPQQLGLFAQMMNAARSRKSPNNMAGLLALMGAGGAASQADAGLSANEPVDDQSQEDMLMARRMTPRPGSSAAGSKPKPKPQTKPAATKGGTKSAQPAAAPPRAPMSVPTEASVLKGAFTKFPVLTTGVLAANSPAIIKYLRGKAGEVYDAFQPQASQAPQQSGDELDAQMDRLFQDMPMQQQSAPQPGMPQPAMQPMQQQVFPPNQVYPPQSSNSINMLRSMLGQG